MTPGRMCNLRQSRTSAATMPDHITHGHDAALVHGNVAHAGAILVDHRSTLEDEINLT
jgi:hypothetical protein